MNSVGTAVTTALVQFVWQGAIVGIALWVALALMKGQSPRARYAAGCMALFTVIMWPLVTGIGAYGTPMPLMLAAAAPMAPAIAARTLPPPASFEWLLPVWALGVTILSIRLVWGAGQIMLLRRRCGSAPDLLRELTERAAARTGVGRSVRVFVASLPDGPCVIGWVRPAIIVPAAALSGLTPEQLEAILAHEMAHIRRFDPFVNAMQLLVETLLFYHPAVWWISSRMRSERELCCDDIAVASSGDAIGYARALTALEKIRVLTPALSVGSTGGSMYRRIERILGAGGREYGPSRVSLVIALAIAVGCSVLFIDRVRAQAPDHLVAGDAFLREGRFDATIQEYEAGVNVDPGRRVTYLKHEIETYIRYGKMREAAAKNADILKIEPSDAEARGLHATFALDAGDVSRALTELQEVIRAIPDNFVAHYNLARAYLKSGDPQSARAELQMSLELRPDYTPAQRLLNEVTAQQQEIARTSLAEEIATAEANMKRLQALRRQAKSIDEQLALDRQVANAEEIRNNLVKKAGMVDDTLRKPEIGTHVPK